MMQLISSEMHTTLISHLTEKSLPLSIILDSSTDSSQNHNLIVYLQALERNGPTVYFYKLISLEANESASGLLNALTSQFDKEPNNFGNYLKRNLKGFASDGAAVMLGRENGLNKLLEDWTGNKLYAIHCMAHRLHLAIRRAIVSIPIFSAFKITINNVHNFYNHHGHKRKQHLRSLAEASNVRMYEISYIFEARWISSEFKAIKNINETWELLITDIESISVDTTFSSTSKSQAKGLSQQLKEKIFVIVLQFMCDVLEHLAHWSKRLQQRNGLLVRSEIYRAEMLSTFEGLKTKVGSFLTYFLTTVVCSDQRSARRCSILEHNQFPSVRWQSIKLVKDGRKPKIDETRDVFLDNIKSELNDYFPEGQLSDFDVLLPEKLPVKNQRLCTN